MVFAGIVMSGIPTIFNNGLPPYTAVGGNERSASTGLSAVLLNRGGRYPRYSLFEDLEKAGFDFVLSMESSSTRYDIEALSSRFPFVRFILLKKAVSFGEEINLAASELSCPLFFVLRSDTRILRGGSAERMAERLLVPPAGNGEGGSLSSAFAYKRLCTVPLIQDGRSETMPTCIEAALVPEETRKQGAREVIRAINFIPQKEGAPSLYPFDGIGIYDRERFIRLGGFDPSISSFHWQLMDFGFRSRLWGEEIAATMLVKVAYSGEIPQEDSTADLGGMRFYLKNIAPVFRGDFAHIPLRRFPAYCKRRGVFLEAWKEFSAARSWVKTNRYRFTSDARTVAERFISFGTGVDQDSIQNENEVADQSCLSFPENDMSAIDASLNDKKYDDEDGSPGGDGK